MEHRNYCREEVNHCVVAVNKGKYIGCFDLTNLGFGGAYIRGHVPDLHEGDLVSILGNLGDARQSAKYNMAALVVHLGIDGVGLMWIEPDSEIYKSLICFLPKIA